MNKINFRGFSLLAQVVMCLLMAGQAAAQPRIHVIPRAFEKDNPEGDLGQIELSNAGHSDLIWRSDTAYDEWPEGGEGAWFSYQPHDGILAAQEVQVIEMDVNLQGRPGGDYIVSLYFRSNDPNERVLEVPITVHLSGRANLAPSWAEDAGYPDAINFNRMFGELVVDSTYGIKVNFNNIGNDGLLIEDIFLGTEQFTLDSMWNEVFLEPDSSLQALLYFRSFEPGNFNDTMVIVSNNHQGDVQVPLRAEIEVGIGEQSIAPPSSSLLSAYPNPFNSRTTIKYCLPVEGWTEVDIVDVAGKMVHELAKGQVTAGWLSVDWDAGAAPAGVYIVRCSAGGSFQTEKVVLLK